MCRRDFKLVENPTAERRTTRKCGAMDDPIRNDLLKSNGSVKQENQGYKLTHTII